MKLSKKVISVILAVVMLTGTMTVSALAVNTENCVPTIVVPGLFQSETKLYENDKATSAEPPFFMTSTIEIVGAALTEALVPISKMLISQEDKDQKAAKALASVLGDALMSNSKCDENGQFIKDIRATKYYDSYADLSKYDKNYIIDQLPLDKYLEIAGEENLYVFSYASLGNMKSTAQELYDFIQFVKDDSGSSKVNIAPVSQGGSITTAVLQLYKDKGRAVSTDINRIVYVIPALNGSTLVGEIYEFGLLDDSYELYSQMMPSLMGTDNFASYLVNIVLRTMPNADLNAILDIVAHDLVNDYLKYSTLLWGLVPSENYPGARQIYLMSEGSENIRTQADWYYHAQVDCDNLILEAKAQGVEVFDLVAYNVPLYELVDSWDDVNADGIIQLDSTSMGAYSAGVNKKLPEDYVPAQNNCTNPAHNHQDPRNIVDARTGLLPETTFYFYNQDHEKTASNDVMMRLVAELLTDSDFTSVFSYPDKYPQFNVGRNSKSFIKDVKALKESDMSEFSAEEVAKLQGAIVRAEDAIEETNGNINDFEAAKAYFYDTKDAVLNGGYSGSDEVTGVTFEGYLTTIFKIISDILYILFDGAGFGEM